MRFIYFLRTIEPIDGGVCKKIKSQIQNLKSFGVNILFYPNREAMKFESVKKNQNKIRNFYNKMFFFNIFPKLKREYLMNIALNDLIKTSNKNDVVYFRFPLPSLTILRILKRPRKCKIVIEHQTIEPYQFLLSGHLIYAIIDLILGGLLIKHADAIVGVTNEITQYELKRSGIPNKSHITIGNGYDVKSVSPRTPPLFIQGELSVLCVAQIDRWHGVDRIIKGMISYSGSFRVKLHIVGTGAEIPNLKKLVDKQGLENNVIFHGFVSGIALDNLFDQCHLAVGSLGIHRIGLKEASILKAREYCSRGIPFIIAYSDPDFPDDFLYIHKILADETPISIDDLIRFTTAVYIDLEHPKKMHDYAMKYLDWSLKMNKLKHFLEDLIKN